MPSIRSIASTTTLLMLLLIGVASTFSSCESQQSREDEDLILEYISANGLSAQATPEGVYYAIDVEGSGARPSLAGAVTVHYEGSLLDGSVFDSSYDRGSPSTFPLANTIAGWQIGLPQFKEGGSGWLLIPSGLAYGENPPSGSIIPENAVLVFRVEVLDVL